MADDMRRLLELTDQRTNKVGFNAEVEGAVARSVCRCAVAAEIGSDDLKLLAKGLGEARPLAA
jgi:hypothetical protein